MSDDDGDEDEPVAEDESDSFLRAVARAPAIVQTETSSLVGRTLGRYEITAPLGSGGMGVVYRARDITLRREVALKVLPDDLVSDAKRRKRFLREARLAAAVTHSNIATLYDVGEEGSIVFLAMELVHGKTLREVVAAERRTIASSEVVRIALAIARGLLEAHRRGIVHRDLKPDNVVVGEDDVVKILDFGLAKLHTATDGSGSASGVGTEPGHVLGTPGYMSPEQARGREVDDRSDVFSFGVLVFELATGERPFRGDTLTDILIAHRRDEPKSVSALRPDLPAPLAELVRACLAKEAASRPSMSSIVDRLKTGIEQQASSTTAKKRRPTLLLVIAIFTFAFMLAVALRVFFG